MLRVSGAILVSGSISMAAAGFVACSSSSSSGFMTGVDAGMFMVGDTGTTVRPDGATSVIPPGHEASVLSGSDAATMTTGDATTTMTSVTTIYANTDTELYSMNPSTLAITDVGTFTGTSGKSTDSTITDLAVNAEGAVYACSESVIYTVTLPTTPAAGTPVKLTYVTTIKPDTTESDFRIYALGFAPAGLLGTGETLIGGDSDGELWAIPTNGGSAQDVGNFGVDPDDSSRFLALSGDVVFYTNAANQPTGLATIRSCKKSSKSVSCTETDDYLAAIDIANLKANYTGGVSTASLLAGIYGGTTSADGNGTGYGDLFGLGAWGDDIYAFSRCVDCYDGGSSKAPAQLLKINPMNGAGTVLNGDFPFTDGWSGAGVTTKVTITVTAPPMTQPGIPK